MTRVKAVVFDIGNVLVEWNPDKIYTGIIPDPETRHAFFEETELDAMNVAVDRGASLHESVAAKAEAFPAWGAEISAWAERWPEMCSPPIDGTVTLLHRLRAAGVPTHALSNFGVETFDLATRLYPFLTLFDIPVISGRERTIKPETRIYEILEERSGLSGDALFFTDDRADNIAAAAARGWQTHLFDGPDGLARALDAAEVPLAPEPG